MKWLVVLVALLAVAGCGSSDDSDASGLTSICPEVAAALPGQTLPSAQQMRDLSNKLGMLQSRADVDTSRALGGLNRAVVDYADLLAADARGRPLVKADKAYVAALSVFSDSCVAAGSHALD